MTEGDQAAKSLLFSITAQDASIDVLHRGAWVISQCGPGRWIVASSDRHNQFDLNLSDSQLAMKCQLNEPTVFCLISVVNGKASVHVTSNSWALYFLYNRENRTHYFSNHPRKLVPIFGGGG